MDTIGTSYLEKLERVYRAFEQSLDLDIAFTVVDLSEQEKIKLNADPMLNARISLCLARERDAMIRGLRDLAYNAVNEGSRLSALKELGRTLYPKRFGDKNNDDDAEKLKRYAEISAMLTQGRVL